MRGLEHTPQHGLAPLDVDCQIGATHTRSFQGPASIKRIRESWNVRATARDEGLTLTLMVTA